jgi:GT2 family glycosyltransferase
MKHLPRVGVVVLNWNGCHHLKTLLPTLRASDHPDFFVIVVDNGSHDGSQAWLSEQPEELLALEQNLRFAGGNNVGARRALQLGADVVLLLNNDTAIQPDTIRALSRPFASNARLGIVGPRIVHLGDPGRIWYGGGIFAPRWGLVHHRALRRRIGEGKDPPGPTDWVSGCALAIRAELWEALGGLDESFYIYAEDVDLCLRARRAGWSVEYVPDAQLGHAVSASVGGHRSAFKSYHRTRSRLQLLHRHGRGPFWLASLFAQDVALALWLAFRAGIGVARAVGEAWLDRDGQRNRYPVVDSVEGTDGSCPPVGPRPS